jgi:hypothetical protein
MYHVLALQGSSIVGSKKCEILFWAETRGLWEASLQFYCNNEGVFLISSLRQHKNVLADIRFKRAETTVPKEASRRSSSNPVRV